MRTTILTKMQIKTHQTRIVAIHQTTTTDTKKRMACHEARHFS